MSGDLASKKKVECENCGKPLDSMGVHAITCEQESFYNRFVRVWHDLIESPAKHTLRYTKAGEMLKEADAEIERLKRELAVARAATPATTDSDLLDTAWKYQCASKTTAEYRYTRGGILRLMRHLEREWKAAELVDVATDFHSTTGESK